MVGIQWCVRREISPNFLSRFRFEIVVFGFAVVWTCLKWAALQ
jgi:hypothetical protein